MIHIDWNGSCVWSNALGMNDDDSELWLYIYFLLTQFSTFLPNIANNE